MHRRRRLSPEDGEDEGPDQARTGYRTKQEETEEGRLDREKEKLELALAYEQRLSRKRAEVAELQRQVLAAKATQPAEKALEATKPSAAEASGVAVPAPDRDVAITGA